jgi:apolipoprotein D and lipocalin family protein
MKYIEAAQFWAPHRRRNDGALIAMSSRDLGMLLLIGLCAGCATGPPSDVTPVSGFDVNQYLGTWYEIARLDHSFERGLSHVTAEYSLNDDNSIKVLNRGFSAERNKWSHAVGKAKFRGDKTLGSLKVSFFGPFYGGYHIVALDDEYQHALVAGPSKNYLWILARSPELEEATYQSLVKKARDLDFQTEDLLYVAHEDVP